VKHRYEHWALADARRGLLQTSRGPVGYLDAGSGPPILYFHGTGAGNELAAIMERALVEQGFRLIIPNRPGYGETPIQCGRTTMDAVWLACQVLDHLRIGRVGVIGTSGGGPPAIAFASTCGDRTDALVLQCAQSHVWDSADWLPAGKGWLLPLLRRRWLRPCILFGYHLQNRCLPWMPKSYLKGMTGQRYLELSEDDAAHELVDLMIEFTVRCLAQPAGADNDLRILLSEPILTSETIQCPTLIIHDRCDPVVPFAHAQWAASRIAHARIHEVHGGGHLIWVGRDAVTMIQPRCEFLQELSRQQQ
jgi:pimeloyl-ACP methyl ester carboxylesterase